MTKRPPDPAWKHFGKQMRKHRDALGLLQVDIAKVLGVVGSCYSSWETGARKVDEKHVNKLDEALKAGGRIAEEWEKASRQVKTPFRFAELPELEGAATQIREFQPLVFPGLLQTKEYARAVFEDIFPGMASASIDQLVQGRMARQCLLEEEPRPLMLFLITEAVFHQQVGNRGPELLHEQVQRVLREMESGSVRVQTIPRGTKRHYGSGGPFRLYTFADEPSIASAEYMTGEAVISDKDRYQECVTTFGLLQGEAHSESASLQMVREMVER
ncbi:helix-turn-helix domain-containing protein [Nocardiopsis dassonvillei]|uniref:helix-turn-helix domain-containing protein n=1 Tax=Nocardiopsis TaxID=2013 RepID=UPI00200F50D6|nr:helix-turn-helix transcriptional regulator [Nocardiopsis dassonvillei]MCK9869583.1 helix-turn-helix transcriptional regulator [Nocardiopsis dassonvillei]